MTVASSASRRQAARALERLRGLATALALALAALLAGPAQAGAHGIVAVEDLPIPPWLFVWGASLVLIVSFVGLSVAWQRPRLEGDDWRPLSPPLSRLVLNPFTKGLAGLLGVVLLVVTVWAGLYGTEAPQRNFAVTFVFVTFWLGMAGLSVAFGDVFRAFNPWRAIARAASAGFRLIAGQPAPVPLRYPERLGRWPAVVGLFLFFWLELVYAPPGFEGVQLSPYTVAVAALVYSAYTFCGMALFGIETWLRRGEAFSVLYSMLARLSVLEVRDGRLGRRRFLAGATGWGRDVPGSVAFVLMFIAGTTYDGAAEGVLSAPVNSLAEALMDAGVGPVASLRLVSTAFMLLTVAFVFAIYWGGIRGMDTVEGSPPVRQLGRAFAHSFIPIALAYSVAHYFSLFVFQIQAQFTYLLSDPLGDGSNYFGTAGSGIDYGILGAELIWYVQVGALVVGHVLALAMGHDKALTVYRDVQQATRSQYWMLALMIGFTSLGLFLLSQANA